MSPTISSLPVRVEHFARADQHPPQSLARAGDPPALRAALELLACGQVPIPWRAVGGDKRPLVPWTQYRESPPSEELVRSWWQRWPDAGLMRIVPAGQVALDVDPRNGGLESLAALDSAVLEQLWSAPRVWSGRGDGGVHFWLASTVDRKAVLRPGLDLLVAGGLEIIAPSLHPATGLPYVAENGAEVLAAATVELPAVLVPAEVGTVSAGGGAPRRGRDGRPLTPEQAAEWQDLWHHLGIALRSGERDYTCPWHEDRTPSLSIHAERGVWSCHGGCGSGGLADLRRRAGVFVSREGPVPVAPSAVSRDTRAPLAACPRGPRLLQTRGAEGRVGWAPCLRRWCEVCGPHLEAQTSAVVLSDLEARGATLHRCVLEAAEVRAWKARVDRRGHLRKQYPAAEGRWVAFSTCPEEGEPVADPAQALAEAFQEAAYQQGRRISGSRCWAVDRSAADGTEAAETSADGEAEPWVTHGYVTASPRWALGQVEKVTGRAGEWQRTPAGQLLGGSFSLSEDPALQAAQVESLKAALGVVSPEEYRARRAVAASEAAAAATSQEIHRTARRTAQEAA